MAYCNNADVIARLSQTGILYLADDDNDSILDANEDAFVTSAINDASTEIDEALAPWFDDPRSCSGNAWLNAKCVDLACERICGRKGQTPPQHVSEAARIAREKLDLVRRARSAPDGLRVPGLVYPGDTDTAANFAYGRPLFTKPRR